MVIDQVKFHWIFIRFSNISLSLYFSFLIGTDCRAQENSLVRLSIGKELHIIMCWQFITLNSNAIDVNQPGTHISSHSNSIGRPNE